MFVRKFPTKYDTDAVDDDDVPMCGDPQMTKFVLIPKREMCFPSKYGIWENEKQIHDKKWFHRNEIRMQWNEMKSKMTGSVQRVQLHSQFFFTSLVSFRTECVRSVCVWQMKFSLWSDNAHDKMECIVNKWRKIALHHMMKPHFSIGRFCIGISLDFIGSWMEWRSGSIIRKGQWKRTFYQ